MAESIRRNGLTSTPSIVWESAPVHSRNTTNTIKGKSAPRTNGPSVSKSARPRSSAVVPP